MSERLGPPPTLGEAFADVIRGHVRFALASRPVATGPLPVGEGRGRPGHPAGPGLNGGRG